MSNKIPFQKPYTNAHDLVAKLQSSGLIVTDIAKAEIYWIYWLLSFVGKKDYSSDGSNANIF